jgi:hypothetical protein
VVIMICIWDFQTGSLCSGDVMIARHSPSPDYKNNPLFLCLRIVRYNLYSSLKHHG